MGDDLIDHPEWLGELPQKAQNDGEIDREGPPKNVEAPSIFCRRALASFDASQARECLAPLFPHVSYNKTSRILRFSVSLSGKGGF